MELTIKNFTNTLDCIKLECKYKRYTYYLSERHREKINGGNIYYIFTKIRNEDKNIINTNDNYIILSTNKRNKRKYHSSKICKRIYYHIININKLDDGKIREYQIFNEFELDVLCNYLLNKNIVFEIVGKHKVNWYGYGGIEKMKYNSEEYQNNIKKYIDWVNEPEANKVNSFYEIYVRVYKGYIDLFKNKEKSKYGIYIY